MSDLVERINGNDRRTPRRGGAAMSDLVERINGNDRRTPRRGVRR
jgi:hypothetical protein